MYQPPFASALEARYATGDELAKEMATRFVDDALAVPIASVALALSTTAEF